MAVSSEKKNLQQAVLGCIFVYAQVKHQYTIPYMYLTAGGQIFKPQQDAVQLQYRNVYRKGQADPDNWRSA